MSNSSTTGAQRNLASHRDASHGPARHCAESTACRDSLCSALDSLDGGIWKWSLPTGEIELSPAWLHSMGYDSHATRTKVDVCRRRVHPADLSRVTHALDQHFARQTPCYTSEHRVRTGNGSWQWVQDRGRVITRDKAGAAVLMVGVVFKIQCSAVSDPSASSWNAARAGSARFRTLGALASGAAHEYSNLLAAILADVRLARGAIEMEQVKRSLDRIERVATQATRVTRSLLALSQGEELCVQPVRLAPLIEDSAEMLRVMLPRHIQVIAHTRDVQNQWVNADAILLSQVLLNLGLNARDAMPTGGTLQIDAQCLPPTPTEPHAEERTSVGRIVLYVRDNGVGMPEHVLHQVFEPRFSTKSDQPGAGLGLAIVKGIVEMHGGRVAVKSSPGNGTCMVIELPGCRPECASGRQP